MPHRKVTKVITKKLGRVRIEGERVWGIANHDTGTIEIDPRCKGIKHLEILIHEAAHITLPFLTEEPISSSAAEIARVLWEQGYRKHDNDTSQKLQDEEE